MSETVKSLPSMENLRARRDEILHLAEQYGAYNVRVFGSVARGEATPDSDVDFIVQFQDWASLYELSGLKQDLQELLGCEVDVVSDHPGMKERLKKHILWDTVPV